ncbi:hypothetical protein B0H13DRAFT_1904912 [Mycena leptocephala]|nr:hypothetical protein B0H13DRAFT_1904912 [Mycena leptocephala]
MPPSADHDHEREHHPRRTKSGEQEGLGEEEESRDKRQAKQEVCDDNRAVGVHAAQYPARSAHGPTQQPHGLAGACGDDLYAASAAERGEIGASTRSLAPLKRWNLRSGSDESATRLGADNDTYFPRTTRRARLGGIGAEVVVVGSGSDKSDICAGTRCSGGSSLPRSEPACHRAGGNDAGRGKKEERRRAFSLLLAPLLRWVLEWGWTRALARTTCLSFSVGISRSVPFPSQA